MFRKYIRIIRILFIFMFGDMLLGQNADELKRFMDTYDKIKVDQEAQQVVKEGIAGEKDSEEGPIRLLVEPGDITEYYRQKMEVIRKDLELLTKLLPATDSIPPIEYFGYNHFSQRDSIPILSNVNITSDYILGYGDEIIISIWGQAEQYDRKSIDRDGSVFIDNVGLLHLGGKTLKDAETHTRNRFEKVYATLSSDPPSTDLELSLGKIKNINVIVSGHVKKPGNYIVNPSINLTNVLIAAGGIDTTGTLRSIKLQRSGTIVDSLDMYPLITGRGIIKSFRLLEGDIILVPPRHGTVAVTGAVLRPAYFEPKKFETLADLFKYSGGKKYNAGSDIVLIRSDNNNQYISAQRLKNIIVVNGDSLSVPFIKKRILNVSISSIEQSFNIYPWYKNLTAEDLLNVANFDTSNISRIELVRQSIDGSEYKPVSLTGAYSFAKIKMEPFDHLTVFQKESFNPAEYVFVEGQVYTAGQYPLLNSQEKLYSILDRSGGLLPSANLSSIIIKRDTLTLGSITGDLIILPGDTIRVNRRSGTVLMKGEVHKPGLFEWQPKKSVKDYVKMAGGITIYGDKKHIVYINPYGKAIRISLWQNPIVDEGGTINVSEKSLAAQNSQPDRFGQVGSIISTLATLVILTNTARNYQ